MPATTLESPNRLEETRASIPVQLAILSAILIPLLGAIAAPIIAWGWGFHWVDLGLLLGMYFVSGLGITVGFHRLLTHRSFETVPAVKFAFAAMGSTAVLGSVLQWANSHRRHHQHSDGPLDPHSPHHHGGGVWGVIRGAWHAHMGWFLTSEALPDEDRVKDLRKSRAVRVASAMWPLWIALGLVVPTVLGGLIQMSWLGALTGLVWGGLLRIFLVHHVTWSVNSACHLWGGREYESGDRSRDNLLFGILALGEGWHHTHHAFPTSARHGLRWWQFDASYCLIRTLEGVGLAWNVRVPSAEARQGARISPCE